MTLSERLSSETVESFDLKAWPASLSIIPRELYIYALLIRLETKSHDSAIRFVICRLAHCER